MKIAKIVSPLFIFLCFSCNGTGDRLTDIGQANMKENEESNVNPIEQAKPEIMVLPSDHNLQEEGALKRVFSDGEWFTLRDYPKFVLQSPDFKQICTFIQQWFIAKDFPLTDFEQTLKSLDTANSLEMADNLANDAKTRLLSVVRPDIILELDYNVTSDVTKSNAAKKGRYILNAIDPYTNKIIASISKDNMEGATPIDVIKPDMEKQLQTLMTELRTYFSKVVTQGREVTVTINVENGSSWNLSDYTPRGDTFTDEIIGYIKRHTVKGAYKLQTNTSNRLVFTNVRIKVLNDDGTQYGVYDWARGLQNYLRNNFGLTTKNNSQGLGDVTLTLSAK